MSVLAVCPPEHIPAVWLFSFVLIFCGAVCGPVFRAAWNHRFVLHHVHLADAANVGAQLLNRSSAQCICRRVCSQGRLVTGNGRKPTAMMWACAKPFTCSQDPDGHLG
jgi:hypothetical protein